MHTPRRWGASAFLLVLMLTVPLLAPAATARAPEGLQFNPSQLNAPASDLALDAAGRFAGVVIQKSSTDQALDRKDLHIYNLGQTGTIYGTASHSNFTADFPQMVALPHGGSDGASKFAVGGPDGTVHVFELSGDDPRWSANEANARTTDVAFTGDGDYVVASFLTLNQSVVSNPGRFAVYSDKGEPRGDAENRYITDLNGLATAVAAPGGETAHRVFAVGTEDFVRFYFSPRAVTDGNYFERATTEVSEIEFSDDGLHAVVGTRSEPGQSSGKVYFYGRSVDASGTPQNSFNQWATTFNNPTTSVTAVTISGDGQYLAAGTADGRIRFLQNGGTGNDHYAIPGPVWEEPNGNEIRDLAASEDGNLILAASGNKVYAFTKDAGKLLWSLDLGRSVDGVDVSRDGERMAAIANANGNGYVYGFKQVHDVDVSTTPKELVTRPNEPATALVHVTNNGSAADTFSVSIGQPSGWTAHPPLVERTILPGRTATVNVTLTPPPLEAPGSYETDIRVISQSGSQPDTVTELETRVLKVPDINITTKDGNLQLRANTEEPYAFDIRNKGNAKAWINFTVEQDHSTAQAWDVRVKEYKSKYSPYELPSGALHSVTLLVKAPASAADGDYNRIQVIADAGDDVDVHNVTARVNPTFSIAASVDHPRIETRSGGSNTTFLRVTNTGNTLDVVQINKTVRPANLQGHWDVLVPHQQRNLTLGPGETKVVPVTIRPSVEEPKAATVTLLLESRGGFTKEANIAVAPMQTQEEDGFLNVPGPGPVGLATALVLAALLTLRNRGRPPNASPPPTRWYHG